MTDATRGLVRYEPNFVDMGPAGQSYEMFDDPSGDWVRYEDAVRIQRARVKLFVRCLEMMAEERIAVLEYGGGERLQKRNERWSKMKIRIAREERRLHRLARYITAKHLGEGT